MLDPNVLTPGLDLHLSGHGHLSGTCTKIVRFLNVFAKFIKAIIILRRQKILPPNMLSFFCSDAYI